MYGQGQVSDKELLKTVSKRMQRGGGGAMTATVERGTVTVKGKIRYEAQRKPILKAIAAIAGVRNIVDQMVLESLRSR